MNVFNRLQRRKGCTIRLYIFFSLFLPFFFPLGCSALTFKRLLRFLLIYLFIHFRVRFWFSVGTIVNIVAIRQFKVCLSVCPNICFGYKPHKNSFNITNITFFRIQKILIVIRYILQGHIKNFFESLFSHYFWIYAPISIILFSIEKVSFSWWYCCQYCCHTAV